VAVLAAEMFDIAQKYDKKLKFGTNTEPAILPNCLLSAALLSELIFNNK
jgi:hypothetical protein